MLIFAKILIYFHFIENHLNLAVLAKKFGNIIEFFLNLFLRLPCAFALVLHIFSRKLSGKHIFSRNFRKIKIFFSKYSRKYATQNLMSSEYFHRNGPFVSHVAGGFVSFVINLTKCQHL
jgi:hypothetical protein